MGKGFKEGLDGLEFRRFRGIKRSGDGEYNSLKV